MSEQEKIELLRIVAPDASEERIRAALRKHPHNLDAAVGALLDADTGDTSGPSDAFIGPQKPTWEEDEQWNRGRGALNVTDAGKMTHNSPNRSQIDLTVTTPQSSTIGLAGSALLESEDKNNSANWALVPTNQPTSSGVVYGPHPNPESSGKNTLSFPGSQQQADDELQLALNASLRESLLDSVSSAENAFNVPALEQLIRPSPVWPVSLRSRDPYFIHAAILIHALYQVPQIRDTFRKLDPSKPMTTHYMVKSGRAFPAFWAAMGAMEMTQASDAVLEDILPKEPRYYFEDIFSGTGIAKLGVNDVAAGTSSIKEMVQKLYADFSEEIALLRDPFMPGLIHSKIWYPPTSSFGFGSSNASSSASNLWEPPIFSNTSATIPLIPINSNINSQDNSLLAYLHELIGSRRLESPAEVLVFGVTTEEGPTLGQTSDGSSSQKNATTTTGTSTPGAASTTATAAASTSGGTSTAATVKPLSKAPVQKHPLSFPARLYVDPFLLENMEVSTVQRKTRSTMELKIRELETRVTQLGGGSGPLAEKGPLRSLRTSIKYYEEIAVNHVGRNDDGGNGGAILPKEEALKMLKHVLKKIEDELEGLKKQIQITREEMSAVYEITALKKHPYDLHAVLMWDGVYGRTHVYSYVKARDEKWYKTVDSTVTEVTEEAVLNDSAGLHLSAGPFMLFYSKVGPDAVQFTSDDEVEPMEMEAGGPSVTTGSQSTVETGTAQRAHHEGEGSNSHEQQQGDERDEENEAQKDRLTKSAFDSQIYASLAADFSQWHPYVRNQVLVSNSEFRAKLEEEGVVDPDGWILRGPLTIIPGSDANLDISESSGPKRLWEDPLSRMRFELDEQDINYDSDPQEFAEDERMKSYAHGGPITSTSKEQEVSKRSKQGDEGDRWGDNAYRDASPSSGGGWGNDTGGGWGNATGGGWGNDNGGVRGTQETQQPQDAQSSIEVQVTVETKTTTHSGPSTAEAPTTSDTSQMVD